MAEKKLTRQYIIRRRRRRRITALFVLIAIIAAIVLGVSSFIKSLNKAGTVSDVSSEVSSSESLPSKPYKVASASIGSTGDLLIHSPILTSAKQSDGSYDFSGIFDTVTPYFEQFDLMVANLEVTLAGDDRAYTGYPVFNCPDSLIDAAVNGGVDMFLTANNHTYDTGLDGLNRTMQVLNDKGVPFIGTRPSETDSTYTVKDINGIKIGMVCYTYSTTTSDGRKALNGNVLKSEAGPLVNTFDYNKLDEFYSEAENIMAKMKNDGADATIIYIHWGNEYIRTPNSYQTSMAQKICDLGYDVIVGGHPHVIQPIETLVSENGHETVCLYSMGNAVSNQRKALMSSDNYSGHTEDGLILGVTFDKYSDGRVVISDLSVTPCWVDMGTVSGRKQYRIVPLSFAFLDDWDKLVITKVSDAKASFNRTMKLVGEGLNSYRALHDMEEVETLIE